MMRLRWFCACLVVMLFCLQGQARKGYTSIVPDDGIHFPRRPLSRDAAERYVFSKKIYFLYRLANPLFPTGAGRDVEANYELLTNGDLNLTFWNTNDGVCSEVNWLLETIPEEGNRAIYTSAGQFPTTGEGITVAVFSCEPESYVFLFTCLDRTKEIVRNGRRVFCAGQYDIIFAVYDYPPDRVKWCAAEKELWKAYGLSFDNENMRFIFTGPPCSQG